MRLEAIPPLKVNGVYLEINTKVDDADTVQKVLSDKVQSCVDSGENCVTRKNTQNHYMEKHLKKEQNI